MATTEIVTISPELRVVSDCETPYYDTLCAIGPYMAERILPHQRFRITRGRPEQVAYTIEVPLEVPTPDIPLPTVVTPQESIAPEQPQPPNRCRATYTTGELLSDRYYSDPLYSAFEQGSSSTGGAIGHVSGLNQIYNNGIRMYGPPADTLCIEKFNKQFGGRSNLTTGRVNVWKADKKDGEKPFEDGEVTFSSVVSGMAFFGFPSFTSPAEPKYYTKESKDKYWVVEDGQPVECNLRWLTTATIAGGSARKKSRSNRKTLALGEPAWPAVGNQYLPSDWGSLQYVYQDLIELQPWLDIPVSGPVWDSWSKFPEWSWEVGAQMTIREQYHEASWGSQLLGGDTSFCYSKDWDIQGTWNQSFPVTVHNISTSEKLPPPLTLWDGELPAGTPTDNPTTKNLIAFFPVAGSFFKGAGDQIYCRITRPWIGAEGMYYYAAAYLDEDTFVFSASGYKWMSTGTVVVRGSLTWTVTQPGGPTRKWDNFPDPVE